MTHYADRSPRSTVRRRVAAAVVPIVMLGLAATLAVASLALADGEDGGASSDPRELARAAVDADPAIAEAAIAALRALGPDGHAALMREHAASIVQLREAVAPPADAALAERVRHAIDVVSGQRDGHASGLYWHTDLGAARSEARRTGRPILSLRLLGRLDEELSCANSRIFRVALYPNREVAALLSSRFVLHWSSVRPAPHITIDMGDGRRIERTITGNSVHYVLDASGRPIDALPGLYAPAQLAAGLRAALALANRCGPLEGDAFTGCMLEGHDAALVALERSWGARRVGTPSLPTWGALGAQEPRGDGGTPSAFEGAEATIRKSQMELPMLRAIGRQAAAAVQPSAIDWDAAGSEEARSDTLDASSLGLLRLKTGLTDLSEMSLRISSAAAIDGVRNEGMLHRRIHEWLAREPAMHTLDALDTRVYAELFLTPTSDPWLGLQTEEFLDLVEIER